MNINWEKTIQNWIGSVIFTLILTIPTMLIFNYFAPKYGISQIGFGEALMLKCFSELISFTYRPSK